MNRRKPIPLEEFIPPPSGQGPTQLLLPAMCPSPQFTHLDSFGHWFNSSLVWSSCSQFRQTTFLCVYICGNYGISWAGLGTCIQRYLIVVRGYREFMVVLAIWRYGVLPYLESCLTSWNSLQLNFQWMGTPPSGFFLILHWIRSLVGEYFLSFDLKICEKYFHTRSLQTF